MKPFPRCKHIRPGARYQHSLDLLKQYKARRPDVSTKSGIMVGLGETFEQVIGTIRDLRAHDVDMITIGQYLQPSKHHAPVERYVHPDEFREYARVAEELGFTSVASGPMVRSSYHADLQHQEWMWACTNLTRNSPPPGGIYNSSPLGPLTDTLLYATL